MSDENIVNQETTDDINEDESNFMPLPADYIIRQQQLATHQMLCNFLTHKDKNITDILNDIRVSLDCLTKAVMQISKQLNTPK